LDDALTLLATLGDPQGGLDLATQARVLLYTESHFEIVTQGHPLVLDPVGTQIEDDYLWIYQERILPEFPEALQVNCTLLHELFDDQENQVNLRVGEKVQTRRFNTMNSVAVF
jgi:uncharacterized protein DUF6702